MKTLSLIKKHLPILLFATTIVTFVSCGGDDDPLMDDSSINAPNNPRPGDGNPSQGNNNEVGVVGAFVEPFHDKNGSRDDIKKYMAEKMQQFYINSEHENGIIYIDSSSSNAVIYTLAGESFMAVVASYPLGQWDEVVKYYNNKYSLVETSSDSNGQTYTYKDKNGDEIYIQKTSLHITILYNIYG